MRFDDIYRDELDYVWNTLRRLGVAEADREDLAHDVFVVVHRRLDDFDLARPIRPWLFGIAYRVVVGQRRRKRVDAVLDDEPGVTADTPHDLAEAAQRRRRVRDALASLPLDKRAVIVMHDIDGASGPDIAAALGIPLNTAYSRLRLARRDLTKALKRHRERA